MSRNDTRLLPIDRMMRVHSAFGRTLWSLHYRDEQSGAIILTDDTLSRSGALFIRLEAAPLVVVLVAVEDAVGAWLSSSVPVTSMR